jgi:hypothetical protein
MRHMRRADIRSGAFRGQTSGLAAGFVQVLAQTCLPHAVCGESRIALA